VWSASLFLRPSLETIHTGSKYTNLPLQLTDLVRGAFHALLQSSYGLIFIILGQC